MNRLWATLSVLAMVAVFAAPSLADMTITLKNGRTVTLPFNREDIDSVTFSGGTAAGAADVPPPPLAAEPAPPARPAPVMAMAPAAAPAQSPSPSPSGRVLHVGPSRDIKTIHAAAAQAKDGDTIEIDAGTYTGDVAVWSANNLTIRGVGNGRAHLAADGEAAEGKAIWVTHGNNTRIENIEFSGATVGDNNGAGIRAEGANLTIFNCFFHDNQEGILTSENPNSDIVIDSSAFVHNGTTSGQTHGIYIGHIRTLVVRGSVFQDTTIGHHIKTRAETNYILYNRILDFANGTASYSIDMSNGGRGYIIGNVIEKGPKADNFTMIAIAMEGPTNTNQEVYVIGNTMVLDRSSGMFVHSRSPGMTVIADNIMTGAGTVLDGNGRLINNVIAGASTSGLNANGGSGNKVVRDVGFIDQAHGDYHLKPGSPAIGAAVDMQQVNGFKLMADYQNLYPLGVEPRSAKNPPDDGAYGFATTVSAPR